MHDHDEHGDGGGNSGATHVHGHCTANAVWGWQVSDPSKTINWYVLARAIDDMAGKPEHDAVLVRLPDGTMVEAKCFSIPEDKSKPAYLEV